MDSIISSDIQLLDMGCLSGKETKVSIKREDLIHPEISGNKWRKLKYNLQKVKDQHYDCILTFGGAFSNHIAATAAAGNAHDVKTIGLIRGEERLPLNPTLSQAKELGMEIHYLSREQYNLKEDWDFIGELRTRFGRFVLVPEGGSNYLGINGCMEIMDSEAKKYDVICVPVGTAGTISGMALTLEEHQLLIGFSALKGLDHFEQIRKNLTQFISDEKELNEILSRIQIIDETEFGGYAKIDAKLMTYIAKFQEEHSILLDPVYTGKMMYRLENMLKESEDYNGKNILAIHTGGIQGMKGFEYRGIIKDLQYL